MTGNQPGITPIEASPTLPVRVPGNGVVSEQTWFPDGQFVDVYLLGDGSGGAGRFANPANIVLHPNGERTFWVGFYPFEVNGVAAFNSETADPTEAYHQFLEITGTSGLEAALREAEQVVAELEAAQG